MYMPRKKYFCTWLTCSYLAWKVHGLFQRVCFFCLTSSWTVFANPTSAVFYYCMSERIFSFSGLEHFRCTSQFSFLWMNSNVLFTCSIFSLFVVVWIVLLGRWVFVYFFLSCCDCCILIIQANVDTFFSLALFTSRY